MTVRSSRKDWWGKPHPGDVRLDREGNVVKVLGRKYSPDQPRVPAGESTGGQWTANGVSSQELRPDAEWGETLAKELRARIVKWQRTHASGWPPDSWYALGHRTNVNAPVFAMAKYIEKRCGDRDAMLRCIESLGEWNTNYSRAVREWQAVRAMHGEKATRSEKTIQEIERSKMLTETDVVAYKARQEWTTKYLRDIHGDEVTLYRGVSGRQAGKILRAYENGDIGIDQGLDLGIHQLSSWTTSSSAAADFAYGYTRTGRPKHSGVVLSVTVPIEQVWLTNELTGRRVINFTDDFGEMVLWSKVDKIAARLEEAYRH